MFSPKWWVYYINVHRFKDVTAEGFEDLDYLAISYNFVLVEFLLILNKPMQILSKTFVWILSEQNLKKNDNMAEYTLP